MPISFTGVVIPFYNGDPFIAKCLESIFSNGIPARAVYIVDNGPQPTSWDKLKAAHPELHIIRTEPRIGFGRACNNGAEVAMADGASQLIFLNQDTIVDQYCLTRLIAALNEDPGVSIAGPLNYTYGFEGMESPYVQYYLSQCPGLITDAIAGTLKPCYDVDKVVGSCFAIRASCIRELGLFDELYFMYSEDGDLCRRYRLAGRRIAVVAGARMAHAHSLTGSAPKDEERIEIWSRRSNLIFILKDIEVPFWWCVVRALAFGLSENLRCLIRRQFGKLFRQLTGDLRDLAIIPAILRSRRQEKITVAPHPPKPASPQTLCGDEALARHGKR